MRRKLQGMPRRAGAHIFMFAPDHTTRSPGCGSIVLEARLGERQNVGCCTTRCRYAKTQRTGCVKVFYFAGASSFRYIGERGP